MATQRWTIIKLVGAAGEAVAAQIERWAASRTSDVRGEFATSQWPKRVREAMDCLIDRISRHSHELSVSHWMSFVDHWSMGDLPDRVLGTEAHARVMADRYDVWCIRFGEPTALIGRATGVAETSQFDEYRWFAGAVLDALEARNDAGQGGALIVAREAFGASPTNEESRAATDMPPDWLRDTS